MEEMFDWGELVSVLIALGTIYYFAMPVLIKAIRKRRAAFVRAKLSLQSELKKTRMEYEIANYSYLESFASKAKWQENANAILQNQVASMISRHKAFIESLDRQYLTSVDAIEKENEKLYINNLLKILSQKTANYQVDPIKLLKKL